MHTAWRFCDCCCDVQIELLEEDREWEENDKVAIIARGHTCTNVQDATRRTERPDYTIFFFNGE